jgi:hypothetical protein
MERLLIVILLTAANPAWAGEVYKWRDSQGGVHYADRPPAKADATSVPVTTCEDDACRELRERAYRETIEQYEAMQKDAAAASKRRQVQPDLNDDRVSLGMTRRMVMKAWGKPAFIKRRAGKFHGGELWIYRDGPGKTRVRFNREGVVTSVDD